jgi:hypothetical protein
MVKPATEKDPHAQHDPAGRIIVTEYDRVKSHL